jgi:amino acid transporter
MNQRGRRRAKLEYRDSPDTSRCAQMNVVWAFLITAVTTALAVTALLLVRRRAPEGGFFEDGDRAAGVFGVLATGFSVLLGFIVFLAFQSYDQSRSGAEQEALVVVQQVENAQFFPKPAAGVLTGELVCYGRSVVNDEWERMRAGTLGDAINPWSVKLFRTLQVVRPRTSVQQSAYDKWLDQTSSREEARRDRVHGAEGVIPVTLWIVLFFVALVIFAFTLFFADRGERAVVQGMLIGSVVSVITVLMLLLYGLDTPFHSGVGGLKPIAMERSLRMVDQALDAVGRQAPLPCTALGKPLSA